MRETFEVDTDLIDCSMECSQRKVSQEKVKNNKSKQMAFLC